MFLCDQLIGWKIHIIIALSSFLKFIKVKSVRRRGRIAGESGAPRVKAAAHARMLVSELWNINMQSILFQKYHINLQVWEMK